MAGFQEGNSATSRILGKAGSINNGKLDHGQGSTGTSPPCPQCGSAKVWKDGIRETAFGPVQRYLCRNCAYRFSDPNSKQAQILFNGSRMSEHVETIHTNKLKSETAIPSYCRVSDELIERASTGQLRLVQSLAEVETRQEKPMREGTTQTADAKGKIIEFGFWMKKQGYKQTTIQTRMVHLETLIRRGANLLNPDSVKKILAMQETWSEGMKANVVDTYSKFLEMQGLTWTPPRYKRVETIPFIPSEAELNQLIGSCGKVLGTFLQGLKESGTDPGELAAITPKDINKEARIITVNRPVKGHRPRILTVSQELIRRLEAIIKDSSDRIFDSDQLRRAFYYKRKTTAHKLTNPRLLDITFTTFRHWFGTMEYHRTKDILHVQRLLGHKSIQNTLIYIDLESKLFNSTSEGFTTRVALNVGEACSLIEAGFEYVTGEYGDGGKIFRKRK